MTLQNNLIPIIAKAYRIERGTTEPVEQWRMRVIYSMLGQMAYASLWDVEENEQPVSVVHFKSRMKKLIESYNRTTGTLRVSLKNVTDNSRFFFVDGNGFVRWIVVIT